MELPGGKRGVEEVRVCVSLFFLCSGPLMIPPRVKNTVREKIEQTQTPSSTQGKEI